MTRRDRNTNIDIDQTLRDALAMDRCGEGDPAAAEHPPGHLLARYTMSRPSLDENEVAAVEAHLESCTDCRDDLAGMQRFDFGALPDPVGAATTAPVGWADRLGAALSSAFSPGVLGHAVSFAAGALLVVGLVQLQLGGLRQQIGHEIAALDRHAAETEQRLVASAGQAIRDEIQTVTAKMERALSARPVGLEQRCAPLREANMLTLTSPAPATPATGGTSVHLAGADTVTVPPAEGAPDPEESMVLEHAGEKVPLSAGTPVTVRMIADWRAGKVMASDIRYDPAEPVAASRDLPLGTRVRIMNPLNGKWIDATVLDRAATDGLIVSRMVYEALGLASGQPGKQTLRQLRLEHSI